MVTAGCAHPVRAAPLNIAQITSVQRYKARIVAVFQSSQFGTYSLTDDILVAGPTRIEETAVASGYGVSTTTQAIFADGVYWTNSGQGWSSRQFTIAPDQQSLLTAELLQLYGNMGGEVGTYDGVPASHYLGVPGQRADAGTLIQTLSSFLQSNGMIPSALPADLTFSVDRIDLWVRQNDQAPLSEMLSMTMKSQGQTVHVDAHETFSDINGSDIDVEPPTTS